ncbi:MAG TPA: DUF1801 domain-containing protein [Flavobacteriales bacterium]|nr:DUF1801 domain-containing protein [Flavobacteriales bacterium]HNU55549.1 DUF1801 domain-containing protein [Flavobacteriales bacterium]
MSVRPVHPDFLRHLERKDQGLIDLYLDLRAFILELHPAANELLYHTHALTSVYGHSDRLADAYVHIPIYSTHLNLGFNKGNLLKDPHELLQGSGNLIRHIPVKKPADYRNAKVKALVKEAMAFARDDMDKPSSLNGATISKIK